MMKNSSGMKKTLSLQDYIVGWWTKVLAANRQTMVEACKGAETVGAYVCFRDTFVISR
jgi:hypothetical protein